MVAFGSQDPKPKQKAYLPPHFVPGEYDVICGRGKECYNHTGNRRFRITIDMSLRKYSEAETKLQKSLIVMSIVDMFRSNSALGGGFVRQDAKSKVWYEIGDEAAREKVGQTIRETLVQQDPEKRAKKRFKRALNKARKAKQQGASSSTNRPVMPLHARMQAASSVCDAVYEPLSISSDEPRQWKSATFTNEDEMLAAIPPQLVLESSREWFKPPSSDSDSDSSDELSDDDFDNLFDSSAAQIETTAAQIAI